MMSDSLDSLKAHTHRQRVQRFGPVRVAPGNHRKAAGSARAAEGKAAPRIWAPPAESAESVWRTVICSESVVFVLCA